MISYLGVVLCMLYLAGSMSMNDNKKSTDSHWEFAHRNLVRIHQ